MAKVQKKSLIITGIIVAAILIVAGVYFLYSKASADAYTESYCSGLSGRAYTNCSANSMQLKKFLMGHSNGQFKSMIKYMDAKAK